MYVTNQVFKCFITHYQTAKNIISTMVRQHFLRRANPYLRKNRKWPHSPYKTKWQKYFSQQQAMQTLKQAAAVLYTSQKPQGSPEKHFLLSVLIDSFKSYNCEPTSNAYFFVIKTLTEASQFHYIPQVLHHLETVENFEIPESIFIHLIRSYGYAGKIQDAVDIFSAIPKYRCVPTALSLNSLLSMLTRKKEWFEIVPQVLLNSQQMNIHIEESTFRILIKALCRSNKVGYAIEMLNHLMNDGYGLDVESCSLILSSLSDQKDLNDDEVMFIWEEMRRLGFCPGFVDYSNMMKLWVRKGKANEALDVLYMMKEDGIKPDIVCYTMVLSAVVAKGEYLLADKLFDELIVLGLIPDVYTYSVYISGLCKQNNLEEALKIVNSMEELGCKANVVTYNTLLGALCKVGEVQKVKELVKEMGLKGVSLNLHTYRIILDGLISKGEIHEAYLLLEDMMSKCFYPRSSTLDDLIVEMCRKGMVTKAQELMYIMVSNEHSPGARGWEAIIRNSCTKLTFANNAFTDFVYSHNLTY